MKTIAEPGACIQRAIQAGEPFDCCLCRNGRPTVVAEPDGRIAGLYGDIARKVAGSVAARAKNMTHKFPNIVVQNT